MPDMSVANRVPKDQTRAVLLAALLGDFGLHHFYLGRISVGVVYLMFCWTGIPGVLGALDARRYAFMNADTWSVRFNEGTPGRPVPRWLPIALFAMPLLVIAVIFGAIYAGYDF